MKTVISMLCIIFGGLVAGTAVAQSGCIRSAQSWIEELQSPRESILQKHSDNSCSFAAQWVEKIEDIGERDKRERTCTHLVLLWTHKDCMYFRDVIDSEAYYPCKEWTREMFRKCMSGNTEWFLDSTLGTAQDAPDTKRQ